ncbi:GlxA family transcriptional regulator [Marinimicrobium alkaliphilum]|uniref:GlxA family transcriptional regulator n=1 Tax=Marinimicrobium alkaliphilum TaxID=2202654 RepID=UPI000DBA9DD8|nr:helix-turn-helix domain-containing protein [Marinimicrobium alkaliphilum]
MSTSTTRTLDIVFVLSDKMLATSATLPMEMLQTAVNAARRERNAKHPQLNIRTAALTSAPVTTLAQLRLAPDTTLDTIEKADIVYLPGLWRNPRPIVRGQPALLDWLRQRYEQGSLLSAVGTGCCFLAEAGLLRGKAATTHWHYFDQFQKDYPDVQLKRQHFITQAGNLYTAASVNSLADLTVHFIQRLYGKAIASHVERHFSHEIRRSYESSGYFEHAQNPHPDEDIVQVQIWLQDNYSRQVSFVDVARQFGMSLRTFNRRFKAATNQAPLRYLQETRIAVARDLLKTSNLSITEIGERVGYQDTSYFGQLFKKLLSVTPREYRATVRAKLFRAD